MAHVLILDIMVVLTPAMYLKSMAESDFEPSSFGTSGLLTFLGSKSSRRKSPSVM
jgi:hypothetical protein